MTSARRFTQRQNASQPCGGGRSPICPEPCCEEGGCLVLESHSLRRYCGAQGCTSLQTSAESVIHDEIAERYPDEAQHVGSCVARPCPVCPPKRATGTAWSNSSERRGSPDSHRREFSPHQEPAAGLLPLQAPLPGQPVQPGPFTNWPGVAPVGSPSRRTCVPLTSTCRTPVAYCIGRSKVA